MTKKKLIQIQYNYKFNIFRAQLVWLFDENINSIRVKFPESEHSAIKME